MLRGVTYEEFSFTSYKIELFQGNKQNIPLEKNGLSDFNISDINWLMLCQ